MAGVEAAGREHDPILFDLGSEAQTRIDIRQAGATNSLLGESCSIVLRACYPMSSSHSSVQGLC